MVPCREKGGGWDKGEAQEGFKDIGNYFLMVSSGQLFYYYTFKMEHVIITLL